MKNLIPLFLITAASLWAQIPDGYYTTAAGLNGPALQQALHDIIDGHQEQSYSSLWTHFQTTDIKSNGKVWDMYSDIPGATPPYEYTFVTDQCGNYSGEGSCYNREHSWPKSWFNNQAPMASDLFHLVPTDGAVNGQRGNDPYGEVSTPSWTSLNGSKKGPNTYPGYSGTVFEPIDAYKGDFARNYFYMSTRYLNEDSGWPGSPMVNGSQLETWALNMLLEWATADPVSQKEIDRNNAIFNIQNNRNPFIDHPEYASLIWIETSEGPTAPADLQASNITETGLDLTWTDNAQDENGYSVYLNNTLLDTLAANTSAYAVTNLQPATQYAIGVSAFNANGASDVVTLTVTTAGGGGDPVTHFLEDFETGSGSSYIDGAFMLASGVWEAYQAGNFTLGVPFSGNRCLAINDDKSGAHITTPAVNTLGTLSFYYYQRNGAVTDEFVIQKSVDGASFELLATQNYAGDATYTQFTLVVNDTASEIRIRILNDNQAGHLIIDNLSLTPFDPLSTNNSPEELPDGLRLSPAFPNPFNPSTTIRYDLSTPRKVTLRILDLKGRPIRTFDTVEKSAGSHELQWNGRTDNAGPASSGVYLISVETPDFRAVQKVVLIR